MAAHESSSASSGEQETKHRTQSAGRVRTALRRGALTLAPIGAAIAMLAHPHAGDNPFEAISGAADTWLLIHVLLFASLSLLGVGVYLLLDRQDGPTALIGRLGAAAFTIFYVGYVAIAGISSGLIVRAGSGLSPEEQAGINAALEYLLQEPAIMAVAVIGALGFLVAIVSISIVSRGHGVSAVPLVLLFGGVIALGVHSGLVAVGGMLAFLIGALWVDFAGVSGQNHRNDHHSVRGPT